ncbi:MAG: glycosyltransferase family 2 protein [bacterium]|nr:glycosyltransferase family 2 protein [bacterium]
MRLVIITISYNSSENTIKLLRSLREQTDKDFSIIVVDNASEEVDFNNLKSFTMGTIACAMVPMVIRNEQNLGFSGGNNVGIKKALENGSDWILLLNNDTWVEKGFITSLRAKLGQLEGVVGVLLDEAGKMTYCGKIKWLKSTLKHLHSLPTDRHRKTVNYAIGGAVAIRKEVFEKIGFWDEKYFLYFEDADFSLKARRAGFPITFLKDIKVNHQVSSSTKKLGSPLLLRYHYRNALYFNLKNGPWYIKLAVWIWSFWIIKKQILKIMFKYKTKESHAILNGVFDFYHHRMGKIKTG